MLEIENNEYTQFLNHYTAAIDTEILVTVYGSLVKVKAVVSHFYNCFNLESKDSSSISSSAFIHIRFYRSIFKFIY
jgi:hypothetical protein